MMLIRNIFHILLVFSACCGAGDVAFYLNRPDDAPLFLTGSDSSPYSNIVSARVAETAPKGDFNRLEQLNFWGRRSDVALREASFLLADGRSVMDLCSGHEIQILNYGGSDGGIDPAKPDRFDYLSGMEVEDNESNAVKPEIQQEQLMVLVLACLIPGIVLLYMTRVRPHRRRPAQK